MSLQRVFEGLEQAVGSGGRVVAEGEQVFAATPEGAQTSVSLAAFMERLAPGRLDTCGSVLPDGVKCLVPTSRGLVVVHQTCPRVYSFRWIAPDSPSRFGPGTEYRTVRIALPFLVVLATFEDTPRGVPELGSWNEAFFTTQPLDKVGVETELSYPALLNCSKLAKSAKKPHVWICTQHLSRELHAGRETVEGSVRAGLGALLHHLLETGFNLSSEEHEESSWFTETSRAKVDPRVSSVEAWEEATSRDPLFVLDVPWLPTKKTLRQVVDRIVKAHGGAPAAARSADDLARVVFQTQQNEKRRNRRKKS